jgi:hypothetical protein
MDMPELRARTDFLDDGGLPSARAVNVVEKKQDPSRIAAKGQ